MNQDKPMRKCYLDIETFSTVPLDHGLVNYANVAEILLVAYAFDDEPVQLWDVLAGEDMPQWQDCTFVIHNSQFDRTLLSNTNTFYIPLRRIHDTMIQALAHGLPGKLETLCEIFGLPEALAKSKEGRQLMHLFCKPNKKGERATNLTHPEQWQRFRHYAKQDVVAMRELYKLMPKWNYPNGSDYEIWKIDQEINDRGFMVDLDLAGSAVETEAEEKRWLKQATQNATDGEVQSATQRDELLAHILKAFGVTLPDMRADTLQRRIEDESLPQALRDLLALRVQSSRNAAAKYKSLLRAVSPDARLRHSLQFCGAATTGRWSGRVFQPQNLPRPTMPSDEIATAIDDIKSGSATMFYHDVPKVLGNCVRGVVIAPPGRKLIACDLSSIEGRMLAWLSDEQFVIDFYRDVDAERVDYDSYMLAYSICFGVDPTTVTKAQRQLGKPIELAHGYGGGVASFLTFAMTYHLDIAKVAEAVWATGERTLLNECDEKFEWAKEKGFSAGLPRFQYAAFEYVKTKWRAARPETVRFWNDLKEAFTDAVNTPDTIFRAGSKIKILRTGQWLRIRLPSGRQLCFLQPRVDSSGLSYCGLNRYTRKWGRVRTHGGKLAGIITQASASDILRAALPRLEERDYRIVLTVHDEAVCEVPDNDEFSVEEVSEIMTTPLDWAPGLPLSADGFETYRYRKE